MYFHRLQQFTESNLEHDACKFNDERNFEHRWHYCSAAECWKWWNFPNIFYLKIHYTRKMTNFSIQVDMIYNAFWPGESLHQIHFLSMEFCFHFHFLFLFKIPALNSTFYQKYKTTIFLCRLTIFIVGLNIWKKGTFRKQIGLFSFPQMLINQFTKLNCLNGNHAIIKQTLIHARKYSLFGNVHCSGLIRLFAIEHYWKIEMNAFLKINAINPFLSKKKRTNKLCDIKASICSWNFLADFRSIIHWYWYRWFTFSDFDGFYSYKNICNKCKHVYNYQSIWTHFVEINMLLFLDSIASGEQPNNLIWNTFGILLYRFAFELFISKCLIICSFIVYRSEHH